MRERLGKATSDVALIEANVETSTDTLRCISRRLVLGATGASLMSAVLPAAAQTDKFEALLAELSSNPTLVQEGLAYTEREVSAGVPNGTPSKRKLTTSASDLIICCEVASPAVYQKKYRRPLVPGDTSGVTVGVGYDLRFANEYRLEQDWPELSKDDRAKLAKALGKYGDDARKVLTPVASVDIPWAQAKEQFFAFLPYPTKQTEDAFPNCEDLHGDSFGALVSLVYNRGPQIARNSKKRHEMWVIQQLMIAKQFDKIPAQFRAMEAQWKDKPDARGLVIRREAEAALFERGLASAS